MTFKKQVIYGSIILIIALILTEFFIPIKDTMDYMKGEVSHYQGESSIDAGQFALIAEDLKIGGVKPDIESVEITEDGFVDIKYDFYGKSGYGFLESNVVSFIDSPSMVEFTKWTYWIPYLILPFSMYVILILLTKSTSANTEVIKFMNFIWYASHPSVLFTKKQSYSFGYSDSIAENIHLDTTILEGILAIRTWKYHITNKSLYSVGWHHQWKSRLETADKLPAEDNVVGLHAFRLGKIAIDYPMIGGIVGLVELRGNYVEHADGVIRAEQCEILFLIINKVYKIYTSDISKRYGCHVIISDNPLLTYQQWLLGNNGLECLKHNIQVLENGELL